MLVEYLENRLAILKREKDIKKENEKKELLSTAHHVERDVFKSVTTIVRIVAGTSIRITGSFGYWSMAKQNL